MTERVTGHERLSLTSPLYGLQGRMELYNPALKGSPQDTLNIRNKSLTVSRETLGQHEPEFLKLLSHASTEERSKYWAHKDGGYEAHMNSWKQSVVTGINAKKTYFSKPEHADFFKTLGVDSTGFNDAKAQELYNKYFSGSKSASHIDTFTQSVLDQIKGPFNSYDAAQLTDHAEGIRFIASIFGKDAADIVMQKLQAAVELANNTERFIENTKGPINNIVSSSREEHLVVYLQKAQDTYQVETTPTPTPIPKRIPPPPGPAPLPTDNPTEHPTAPPGPEIDKKLERLTKRFAGIRPEPRLNHLFVVTKIPNKPVSENLDKYELVEPFFIAGRDEKGEFVSPNTKTSPYFAEIGDTAPKDKQNGRFLVAEDSTNGDSGTFAIAAASAKTPQEQAKLYSYIAESVIAIHEHNPKLLGAWIAAQKGVSEDRFIEFDDDRHRPEAEEKLLEVGADYYINNEATVNLWKNRIKFLKIGLKTGSISEHHIRWIEFLSHSVRVPELIKEAQKP